MVQSVIRLAEEGSAELIHSEAVPSWLLGAVTFAVLMLALFIVTRFDPDR